VRRVWEDYYQNVNGIVYIVDMARPDRFAESAYELRQLLTQADLKDVPFAILGNKIDCAEAVSEQFMKDAMGISTLCTGKDPKAALPMGARPLEVFMVSVINGQGYGSAFKWLSSFV
jgi:GTP-binding protein SAR1